VKKAQRLSTGLLALFFLSAAPGRAVNITVINADSAGEGFNDTTPAAAVAGNSGATVGQQRLNVFAAAASYWGNRLSSTVPVTVLARMDPLVENCSPTAGLLGAAGPTTVYADIPNAPHADTWYLSALANAFNGSALDPATPDIVALFNSAVGTASCLTSVHWWYGIGTAAPAGTISFYNALVHELAHGLGFLTLVDVATGKRLEGDDKVSRDDGFMLFLENHATGKTWGQMTNAERASSAKASGSLHWTGPAVVAASSVLSAGGHPSGHVRMYAPSTLAPGSSVAHWDIALTPDEIMEPFDTASPADLLTTQLLKDIGWTLTQTSSGSCVADANTACLQSGRFEVKVDWQTASANGSGQVMSFGGQRTQNDESVFWSFFSATNFEMGVKVLNGCGFNAKYWVFISGLTDQGWTVHVRDTQTGATRTYSNAVGQLSETLADTSALSCN
jgi:hypothetical protein